MAITIGTRKKRDRDRDRDREREREKSLANLAGLNAPIPRYNKLLGTSVSTGGAVTAPTVDVMER
jgi:hypothetical protein